MLLLGIDIGTSSIKISVVDPATQKTIASLSHPGKEIKIILEAELTIVNQKIEV